MAYYGTGCDEDIADHSCGGCSVELARVRSWAFVRKSYQATLAANPADDATWDAGIASGEIILIPSGQGEYDGGTANKSTGDGDLPESIDSYSFSVSVMDPNYADNRDFYNSIKKSKGGFYFAFRSESIGYITDKPVLVAPKNPIANDDKAKVKWLADITWVSENFPEEFIAPESMKVCYIP